MHRALPSLAIACGVVIGLACDRGSRDPGQQPAGAQRGGVPVPTLTPGPSAPAPETANPFAGDSRAIAEGRRLYNWMNCSGCHFEGGGGIGPPLMTEHYIYGHAPAQVFDSIANGRTNGMPAFGSRLPPEQIWQIVAYVETLREKRTTGGRGESGPDESSDEP
ncbi:MAG TPA: cytochrome c [Vicinamibacterales bacterium]|nr:cytochrome c [Vicinamibacterales bacterium]